MIPIPVKIVAAILAAFEEMQASVSVVTIVARTRPIMPAIHAKIVKILRTTCVTGGFSGILNNTMIMIMNISPAYQVKLR
jgi:hypothetical protein